MNPSNYEYIMLRNELDALHAYLLKPERDPEKIEGFTYKIYLNVYKNFEDDKQGLWLLASFIFEEQYTPEMRYYVLSTLKQDIHLLKGFEPFTKGCFEVIRTDEDITYKQHLYKLIKETSGNSEGDKDRLLLSGVEAEMWDLSLDNLRAIKYDNSDCGMVNRWFYYNLLSDMKRMGIVTPQTMYLDDIFGFKDSEYFTKILFTNTVQVVTKNHTFMETIITSKVYFYKVSGTYDVIINKDNCGFYSQTQKIELENRQNLETLNYFWPTDKTIVEQEFSFTEGHIIRGQTAYKCDRDSLYCFSAMIPKRGCLEYDYLNHVHLIGDDSKDFSGYEFRFDNPLFLPQSLHSYLDIMRKCQLTPAVCKVFVPNETTTLPSVHWRWEQTTKLGEPYFTILDYLLDGQLSSDEQEQQAFYDDGGFT